MIAPSVDLENISRRVSTPAHSTCTGFSGTAFYGTAFYSTAFHGIGFHGIGTFR